MLDIAWDLWKHQNSILYDVQNVVSNLELCTQDRNVTDEFSRLQPLLLPAYDRHLMSLNILTKLPSEISFLCPHLILSYKQTLL